MKKWEKPELKVLGVENTKDGGSLTGIHAPQGHKWVCAACYGDPRGDINEKEHYVVGDIYYTPHQSCGEANCNNKSWIQVSDNFTPPNVELS